MNRLTATDFVERIHFFCKMLLTRLDFRSDMGFSKELKRYLTALFFTFNFDNKDNVFSLNSLILVGKRISY